jgi:pimeloyl-ACP methyl ester carboxylesterase
LTKTSRRAILGAFIVAALHIAAAFVITARVRPHRSLRFDDVKLKTGVRLRYAEQGNRTGPAVIMLHGYSDSWFSFSGVLPLLPPDYHAFALDLRGHGGSEQPASGYTMRELGADVIAFMDAKKITRATIVGHSMGSFVAQQVALAAPDRVDRLVLVASTTTPRTFNGVAEFKEAVYALGDDVPVDFVREFQYGTTYVPVDANFMERVVKESMKLTPHVWKSIIDGMLVTERPEQLRELQIPTLIVWGDRDNYCPRSEQDALLAMLPGAVLKVYPDVGHATHWEQPEQFVRDLQAFMNGD